MFWYRVLFYLDLIMWYMQHISAAVILGWFIFYLGRRLLEKYRNSAHRFWRVFFARRF